MFAILWNGVVFGRTLRLLDVEKLNLHIFNVSQTLEYADTDIALKQYWTYTITSLH